MEEKDAAKEAFDEWWTNYEHEIQEKIRPGAEKIPALEFAFRAGFDAAQRLEVWE